VPVVKIEDAKDALSLGKALLAGDLPVAEVTFRTAAAEDAIKVLTGELPDLLVGAGTVGINSPTQIEMALERGKLKAIYLDKDVSGFAIHLLQK